MPKEGHVSLEDLDWQFGSSTGKGSLFLYSEEENEFRQSFRKYVVDEALPHVEEIERTGSFDLIREIVRDMGRRGYIGVTFLEDIGGGGKGSVYRSIIAEELTAASFAVSITYGASSVLYACPIMKFGDKLQKDRFLKSLMSGEKLGAIGITEPGGGSDAVGGMKTRARLEGDEYVINGEKRFITNGSRADFILLYAITNPEVRRREGMSAFIFPTDTEGFEVVKDYELMGRSGSVNSHLRFNDCRIPRENLLGQENRGFQVLMEGLNDERVFAASQYIGVARSAFEIATKYSAERMQFRKAIREFEGVSFKIADMYASIESGRLLVLRAARMIDAGVNPTKEVAAAKFFTADKCTEICAEAFQILGGIGYTTEYPLERYLRDIRIAQIGAGSSEIMRFLAQRELYKEIGY
jgi:alkylation response protein AidB-like acyl-CoA dehydrogenase